MRSVDGSPPPPVKRPCAGSSFTGTWRRKSPLGPGSCRWASQPAGDGERGCLGGGFDVATRWLPPPFHESGPASGLRSNDCRMLDLGLHWPDAGHLRVELEGDTALRAPPRSATVSVSAPLSAQSGQPTRAGKARRRAASRCGHEPPPFAWLQVPALHQRRLLAAFVGERGALPRKAPAATCSRAKERRTRRRRCS